VNKYLEKIASAVVPVGKARKKSDGKFAEKVVKTMLKAKAKKIGMYAAGAAGAVGAGVAAHKAYKKKKD
jgi:hypothetical protein